MRLSALDLVTKILGDQPEYKSWKLGLFKGKAFTFFFDAMQKDKLGSRVMEEKLKEEGLNSTVKVIKNEMKAVKKLMKMSVGEVTPEFLYAFDLERDVTLPFTQTSPVLQTVLLAAIQSPRALRENSRTSAPVSLAACVTLH